MKAISMFAAVAAGVFAMSAAQAQDMQMSPAQGSTMQQSAQGSTAATGGASYGGAMSTTKASGASRDAWMSAAPQPCTPGLSCNIFQGQ